MVFAQMMVDQNREIDACPLRRGVARSAGELRRPHDLLQLLRSLTADSEPNRSPFRFCIGDPTYAGAILDRLVRNANRIELADESMRRTHSKHQIGWPITVTDARKSSSGMTVKSERWARLFRNPGRRQGRLASCLHFRPAISPETLDDRALSVCQMDDTPFGPVSNDRANRESALSFTQIMSRV
jgi:hypothetical protein